ncbi:gas vesicle protein GvpO [Kribbella amoyensis]|uniref:Gas vesicle protein GvpO n=1 Tax=Kribbella amoyensis TaxID=996641 RepID=A0A561BS21_9ACTN|nr:gas vesicle protein [Kribbella amoyensis]TWD81700.1 gas vesicle protein GvpO [Kribbella amoyensis]
MTTTRRTGQQSERRRNTAKKATARPDRSRRGTADEDRQPSRSRKPSLRSVALSAATELSELIGHQVESVVAIDRDDDGWKVQVEVVESRRVPDTTDILAIYEVETDGDGAMTGYRRLGRHVRGRTQE